MLEAIHHIERKLAPSHEWGPSTTVQVTGKKILQIQQPKCVIGRILTHSRGKKLTRRWELRRGRGTDALRHPRACFLPQKTLKTPGSPPLAGSRPRQMKIQWACVASISHIARKHGPAMVQQFVHFQLWDDSADFQSGHLTIAEAQLRSYWVEVKLRAFISTGARKQPKRGPRSNTIAMGDLRGSTESQPRQMPQSSY